jgi:hypothetical protein
VSSNTPTLSDFGTPVRLLDDYIMPCKKHPIHAIPCWIETAYPWARVTLTAFARRMTPLTQALTRKMAVRPWLENLMSLSSPHGNRGPVKARLARQRRRVRDDVCVMHENGFGARDSDRPRAPSALQHSVPRCLPQSRACIGSSNAQYSLYSSNSSRATCAPTPLATCAPIR